MMNLDQICNSVCAVAREAGDFIMRQRKTFTRDMVETKGIHNIVSYVDRDAEKMIVQRLRDILPEAGFITEEGSARHSGQRYKWVVDPLDGTTNFVHGLPPYCVSIGLVDGQDPVVGVIYEITHGEMFHAFQGGGSYLDDQKIKVSTTESIDSSLIAVGFPHWAFAESDDYLNKMGWYQRNSDGIRRIGSSAADLSYVACGRFDAFMQIGLSPWDVAAGVLIVREAGGRVTDFDGRDNCIFGREIVAANNLVFDQFIKTVK